MTRIQTKIMPKERNPLNFCPYRDARDFCRLGEKQATFFPARQEGQTKAEYSAIIGQIVNACLREQTRTQKVKPTPVDVADNYESQNAGSIGADNTTLYEDTIFDD